MDDRAPEMPEASNSTPTVKPGQAPSIFDYLNYRLFLKDYYESRKASAEGYSYNEFAKRAGVTRNYLKLLIDGKRRITSSKVIPFGKALGLKGRELRYLEVLVAFSGANDVEEKMHHLRKLAEIRGIGKCRTLQEAQLTYLSRWYMPVIREMIALDSFNASPEVISAALSGEVTPREVSEALQILLDCGLVEQTSTGFAQKESHLRTDPEISSLAIRSYHRAALSHASCGLEEDPTKREFGSLTLPIDLDSVPLIKEKIREFQNAIMEILRHDRKKNSVYQLNLQFFPCIRLDEEKKKVNED